MADYYLNDEVMLDRLVDGELSAEHRRAFLAAMEHSEGGWRRCALAFLEAQSWRSEFKQLVDLPQRAQFALPAKIVGRRTQRLEILRRVSFVAVPLAAFLAGLVIGQKGELPSPVPSNRPHQIAGQVPTGGVDQRPATEENYPEVNPIKGDVLTLWVHDEQGQPQTVEVPLLDADTLDSQLGTTFRSGIPQQVCEKLADHGFQVESRRHYAPLWIEDGISLIVPVEDTKIVPASRPVY
jgi:hypothetical protein